MDFKDFVFLMFVLAKIKLKRGVKMQENYQEKTENEEKSAYSTGKIFLKSLVWTLAALTLIAIGFYGADLLFG